MDFAITRGRRHPQLLAWPARACETQARALDSAFFNDLLPVAASGNSGDQGNPLEFPAAAVGGFRGEPGIGLSVAAAIPTVASPVLGPQRLRQPRGARRGD